MEAGFAKAGEVNLWADPSNSSAPRSHLLSPPQWEGGENWMGKSEKTCGMRQRLFNSKSCVSKQSKIRN